MATADLALANDRLKGSQAQLRELSAMPPACPRVRAKACRPTSRPMRPSSSWLRARRCRRGRCAGRHGQHKLEHARLKLQQMSLSAPEAGTVVARCRASAPSCRPASRRYHCCRRARCRYVPNSARPTPMPCRWHEGHRGARQRWCRERQHAAARTRGTHQPGVRAGSPA